MCNKNPIFTIYKSLKNHLKKLSLDDSLYVLWAYIQNLQFNNRIPNDIELSHDFKSWDHIQKSRHCSEWELETLTREIIINSGTYGEKSLKKWSYFAGAINKLKSIENKVGERYVNQKNILNELFRIAHRQFPWQQHPNSKFLTRYYKIFGEKNLNDIIQKKIGISTREIYIISLALVGSYLKSPAIKLPIKLDIAELSTENIKKFIEYFSICPEALRETLMIEEELNDKFSYSFNSMRAFPLLKMFYRNQNCLICPLPTLLFWRITSGIYYEIYKEKDFDNSFGSSFEQYVGEVIAKAHTNQSIQFCPEILYCKKQKRSSDWLVYDPESILFIECKTKRLRLPAKLELNDESVLMEELNKMADIIKQVYKTIYDYKNNKYDSLKYDPNKKIFPLIVTLENWYLFGNKFSEKLDELVVKKLNNEGIEKQYLQDCPYSICSIDEFEEIIQIVQTTGISNFFSKKLFDPEKRQWAYASFMQTPNFQETYKNVKFLFSDNFEELNLKK